MGTFRGVFKRGVIKDYFLLLHVKKSVKALLHEDLKEVSLHYSLKQTLCNEDKV